jgi:hypothetical protein
MAEERMLVRLVRVVSGRLADRLAVRAAFKKAKELMEKKCLTCDERRERDSLVTLLGEKGNSSGHALLKEWAVRGELCCRPPAQVLGGAIAAGGYDELHVKRMGLTIAMGALAERVGEEWVYGREVPVDEQYYLAALITVESGLLLQYIRHGDNPFLALLEASAARLVADVEGRMPGMVELLRKEMEA